MVSLEEAITHVKSTRFKELDNFEKALKEFNIDYQLIPTNHRLVSIRKINKYNDIIFDSETLTYSSEQFNKEGILKELCRVNFIIHIPEIKIRTRTGSHERTLYDFYINIDIADEENYFATFTGLRTSYAEDEYFSGYNHSHLSGFYHNKFSNFCLGSGELANPEKTKVKDYDDAVLFLINLKTYLGYESTDTAPYKYLRNIKMPTSSAVSALRIDTFYDGAYIAVTNFPDLHKFIYYDENRYKLNVNDKFLKKLEENFIRNGGVFQFFEHNNKIYRIDDSTASVSPNAFLRQEDLFYKGVKIERKIFTLEERPEIKNEFIKLHINSIKNYVENKINSSYAIA